MTLSFDNIFSDFLGYVTDYDIASMNMQNANDLMSEYLRKACSEPYLRSLFSLFNIDSEIQIITFEMKNKTTDDEDIMFVSDVIALGMIVSWLKPLKENKLLLNQFFSGKEQKWYNQRDHLAEVKSS